MTAASDRPFPPSSWTFKTAAFIFIVGVTGAALVPVVKQAVFVSTSYLRPNGTRAVKMHSGGSGSVVSEVDNVETVETHHVCPPLADIVSCPNNPDPHAESLFCRDCIDEPLQGTYHINANALESFVKPDHKIYMPILAPPFFGSSVLSNIISSSPNVSNMCKDPYKRGRIPWQCESTPTLVTEGIIKKKTRWDPIATNWTEAYRAYERLRVWRDMDAPIRLDKAPPNIAKAKQLVEYFEGNELDYRFIIMMRHPCRNDWKHPEHETERYSKYLRDMMQFIPEKKRFLINYDDLVTRPGTVLRSLLNWLPALSSLSTKSNEMKSKRKKRSRDNVTQPYRVRMLRGAKDGGRLQMYIESDECRLALRPDYNTTRPNEIKLWNQHFAKDKLPY